MELLDYKYKNPWMDVTPENGNGDLSNCKKKSEIKKQAIKTLVVYEGC